MTAIPDHTRSIGAIRGALLLVGLATTVLAVGPVAAYEQYSEDGDSGNCADCHGNFRDTPYISLVDGMSWGDDLHDVHRRQMLDSDCDTCHGNAGFFPVSTFQSAGGDGLAAISCVGCHARDEGGTVTATGLRQHHWRAGITDCEDCHSDADPAFVTPVAESVLPPFYAQPGNNHPAMPDDPCNPPPGSTEDFAGSPIGLDNDGDNLYDTADGDCAVATQCGNGILEPGEECDDGNTLDGDCCSSTCTFEPVASPCDNGLFCTVSETCDGAGGCGGGMPRDCDDADICTDDSCNEAGVRCDNVFDPNNDPSCTTQCPDDDSDGASPAGGSCGPVDCDDNDPAVFPGAAEICDDGKDNDCNGLVDAADPACGDFDPTVWAVRDGPLDDPAYAGSNACISCHPAQGDSWLTSLHARLLIPTGDAQAAGFPLPPFDPPDVTVQSWNDVLFVVGQKWKTRWVDRSGLLQGRQWNFLLDEFEDYNGGVPKAYDCGACHTTGYDPDATFLDDQGQPVGGIAGSWVEYNVGCEACHGPAAEHAAAPSRENINRILYDWYDPDQDGEPDPVDIRSSMVCGNCHYRGDRDGIQTDRKHHEQYNDWLVSGHATSLENTAINTFCAQCHSPGNAEAFAREHNFTNFDPKAATHTACISCHDPHRTSHPRWAALEFDGGSQDPRDFQATIARYRGTDHNVQTVDYVPFDNDDPNALCSDCHREQAAGFRRHIDARPEAVVVLEPPFSSAQPQFFVPHREHIEEGYAECVDCHMPYSRESINEGDVRTHSFLPNEAALQGFALWHFSDTCGQCHSEAQDCEWCHTDFGSSTAPPGASLRTLTTIRSNRSGPRESGERGRRR